MLTIVAVAAGATAATFVALAVNEICRKLEHRRRRTWFRRNHPNRRLRRP